MPYTTKEEDIWQIEKKYFDKISVQNSDQDWKVGTTAKKPSETKKEDLSRSWQAFFTLWLFISISAHFFGLKNTVGPRYIFICGIAYSHLKHRSKRQNFQSKCVFLSANTVLAARNSGTYVPGITRPTCKYVLIHRYKIKEPSCEN